MAGQPQREWTDNDQALLYTVHLVADLLADRPMRPAPVRTPFPPQYSREEQYLASSNFTLYSYRGLGDGSYMHDSSFFFATGSGGLAATAGFAAARPGQLPPPQPSGPGRGRPLAAAAYR
jgi:hypothetical protein